eukprot:CAMPEP_0181444958 /NCGR_PEP_ID=MMETSP1110-20121109/25342_1 /TAXON_ID=174948 /ORGANISM="Symbiodinium sp., Strain CCMP421" /LENGTH=308 /DNA_ID=CAMNT_0023568991 /DNA_START=82 /DNA_END=1008 /DNA_ORIENTATION=+
MRGSKVGADGRKQSTQGMRQAPPQAYEAGQANGLMTPQPRRPCLHVSPSNGSTDEAAKELRALMSAEKTGPGWDSGSRCWSSQSTSAGPTPTPECRSPYMRSPASPYATPDKDDRNKSSTQDCKVFVGGVPQSWDSDTHLKDFFNRFGHVKKAWLQKHNDNNEDARYKQNHRGFGFVVFQSKEPVEMLLGQALSIKLDIGKAQPIEVKAAQSSATMKQRSNCCGSPQQLPAVPQLPSSWASPAPLCQVPLQSPWPRVQGLPVVAAVPAPANRESCETIREMIDNMIKSSSADELAQMLQNAAPANYSD